MGVVLVVDDTVEIADLVVEILGDAGYAALRAGTYDEATHLIREQDVALVLLDTMGDANIEFLPHLAEPRPPIVLFSAWTKLEDRARSIGAEGWLAKPFAVDDLIATVRTYLRTDVPVEHLRETG